MKTGIKIIFYGFLCLILLAGIFCLFGAIAGISFSMVGAIVNILGAVLRLAGALFGVICRIALNPVVLILLVIFLLSNRYKGFPSK